MLPNCEEYMRREYGDKMVDSVSNWVGLIRLILRVRKMEEILNAQKELPGVQSGDEMNEQKWDINPPKESGYYLATWGMEGDKRKKRVSEFWFDGRNWWTGRPYTESVIRVSSDYLGDCVTEWVFAWTQKPKPYTGSYDVRYHEII